MSVPDWVQDAIFYQIFPDRFFDGDPANNPPNTQIWGATPTGWGFQGGDLIGITNKLDYLIDLGINALYINPIFQATSNHRYNTTDYYKIDPKLGTMDDFRTLIKIAHQHDIRIILDGVFNHCGRGFFAFNDILENQEYSAYRDWFHIYHFPVDAYQTGEAKDYVGWWGMKSLPKFNTDTTAVRNYLFEVAKYWIQQGADGWRLDVPNEINDDVFWNEFRQGVKEINPQAYILGEIWKEDMRWIGDTHFDGLMNYPLVDALTGLLVTKTLDVDHFAKKVESLYAYYPRENALAMFNCISSHDTERILTRMGNHLSKTKLAYSFQFAFPGAPSVYYGDEIGLVGAKDPGCRGAFPWDESQWNKNLRNFIQILIAVRKQHLALRRGDIQRIDQISNQNCYAFMRKSADDVVVVLMNPTNDEQRVKIDFNTLDCENVQVFHDLIDHAQSFPVIDRAVNIDLPAWGSLWLG